MIVRDEDMRATIVRYDSLTEACSDARHEPDQTRWENYCNGDHRWDMGVKPLEALRRGREGDPSIVRAYQDKIAHVTPAMSDQLAPTWVADVAGSTPIIPATIAGHPMAMRRRVRRPSIRRSVKIYVSMAAAYHVTGNEMLTRGATILALVESLQSASVHVDFSLVLELPCNPKDHVFVIPLESPLDLSRDGFAIAHPSFARHVGYIMLGYRRGYNGHWPRYDMQRDPKAPAVREMLSLASEDVYVSMARGNEDIIRKPQEWLARHLSQMTGNGDNAS